MLCQVYKRGIDFHIVLRASTALTMIRLLSRVAWDLKGFARACFGELQGAY